MTYPTILQYVVALSNGKQQLRTLSRSLTLQRDSTGEPIYSSSRGTVLFAVNIDNQAKSVRLRLSSKGKLVGGETLLENEIYVLTTGASGDYFDLMIQEPQQYKAPVIKDTARADTENRIAFEKNGLWGFYDHSDREVIAPQWDYVEEFPERRTVVERNGYYGLIDADGNVIIEPTYDEMSYDGSHLCYVEHEGACGVIDRSGRTVIKPRWDWTAEFSQGLILVELDGKFGFVDDKDEIVIEPKYSNATSFDSHNYATVELNGRTFQIDKQQYRV